MIENVLIVYEEELFAEGLSGLMKEINPNININKCILYDDVEKSLTNYDFDIVFISKHRSLDISYVCPIIKQHNPECMIVFMASSFCADDVKKFMEFNANGLLCKKYSIAKIKSILSLLLMGDNYYPSELLPYTTKTLLSKQQLKIVKHLRLGSSNKQIAYDMNITEATVKAHMTIIFRKLGVVNRIQAIQKVLEMGLLEY